MIYSKDKDMNKVIRLLMRNGWRYQRCRKHGMLIAPSGARVIVSMTPSCSRTQQNFYAQIRFAGKEYDV